MPSIHQKAPLHMAAGEGRMDIVRYLVENREADIFVRDNHGVSNVSHLTFRGNMLNTVKPLITEPLKSGQHLYSEQIT